MERSGDDGGRAGARARFEPGRVIEGFRIVRRLGRGGMGEVYLAYEESLERKVALKVLAENLSDDPSLVKRFAREARVAARLNHPNIVTIYSVHEAGDLTFFAMEYIEGESLAHLIEREGPLPVEQALAVAEQAAEALGCAHGAGILHRDVKPSNIMVTPSGVVKVLDFGIAKVLGEKTELTRDGTFLGTLSYASPEQCDGVQLDARTDIYSLGVVLYEMLAGRLPFEADTPLSLIKRIATEKPPDLVLFNPAVPVPVGRLVERMIEKDRDLRPASCVALAEEIGRLRRELEMEPTASLSAAQGEETRTMEEVVPLGRPLASDAPLPGRKRRSWWWVAGWIVFFAIAAVAWHHNRSARRDRFASRARLAVTPTPAPTAAGVVPGAKTPTPVALRPTATPAVRAVPTPAPSLPAAAAPPARRGAFSVRLALAAIPADRDLVCGFNVRSFLNSRLVRSNESKVFSPEAVARLDALFGPSGIEWRRDIYHLVLAGTADRPETLSVIFNGKWEEGPTIERLRRDPTYRVFEQNGFRIHGVYSRQRGRLECLAFLGPGVAVCGLLPALREVCETASKQRPSLLSRPEIAGPLSIVADMPTFWAIGLPRRAGGNPALGGLVAWILRGRLDTDLYLDGIAWPRDRSKIEGTYNLFRAVVNSWRNNRKNPELRKLGANVSIGRTPYTLSVSVRVPYADLVRILDRAVAQGKYPFR